MSDALKLMQAWQEAIDAQHEYNRERAYAIDAGDRSFDWSGRCIGRVEKAQERFQTEFELYVGARIDAALAERGGA